MGGGARAGSVSEVELEATASTAPKVLEVLVVLLVVVVALMLLVHILAPVEPSTLLLVRQHLRRSRRGATSAGAVCHISQQASTGCSPGSSDAQHSS